MAPPFYPGEPLVMQECREGKRCASEGGRKAVWLSISDYCSLELDEAR